MFGKSIQYIGLILMAGFISIGSSFIAQANDCAKCSCWGGPGYNTCEWKQTGTNPPPYDENDCSMYCLASSWSYSCEVPKWNQCEASSRR